MYGLDAGVREVDLVRRRARRLFGMGRLSRDHYLTIDGKIKELSDLFQEYLEEEENDDDREKAEASASDHD